MSEGRNKSRLLVVSHPAVVTVNQEVYRDLAGRGRWDITIVVPDRWVHPYSDGLFRPEVLEGMETALHPMHVVLPGRPQRHFYVGRLAALCAEVRPDVAFIEAEPFSLSASQWRRIFSKQSVPFGVQCAENIDRKMPMPLRHMRDAVLKDASFVAARSETAAELARQWGARGKVAMAPHAVPGWEDIPKRSQVRPFTIGYAGRLVESKGLLDLLAAVRLMDGPVELLMIGDGELRSQLEGEQIPGSEVRVIDDLTHAQMPSGYAQIDVLVLPSHTTSTWKEQFGRVIVEALWCGVPVVGSDSGEIPWLIEQTQGGLTFPEGNVGALTERLSELSGSPEHRERLARTGRRSVERLYSVPAATDAFERLLPGEA
jgi:glycosyltransferase involved in cell wall biosynthesis